MMELTFSHAKDKEKVMKSINKILKENRLLTLATSNKNQPHCNTAFYVFDDEFNLFILTGTAAKHSRNIKINNKVGVNIFNSRQAWGSLLFGMQASGHASIANSKEMIKAWIMYLRRYPKAIRYVKNPVDFHKKMRGSDIYKIELDTIKLFDVKTFGRDEFREVSIRR